MNSSKVCHYRIACLATADTAQIQEKTKKPLIQYLYLDTNAHMTVCMTLFDYIDKYSLKDRDVNITKLRF